MRRALVTFREPSLSPFDFFSRELERELSEQFTHDLSGFYETEDAYLATIDVPGVSFSDIHIDLEENKLSVSAERKDPFDKTGTITRKYNRVMNLPKNVDSEKINAHYENGVLSLTIPKAEEIKTKKKIEVLTGEKPKTWASLLSFGKTEKDKCC